MLRKWTVRLVVLGLALVMATPVILAQRGPAVKKPAEPQLMDFEGDTIETEFLRPNMATITGAMRKKRGTLIKPRIDFINEIVRSAEDI